MRLLHPCPGARITQRYGANPGAYAAYGLPYHMGVDFACPVGTPIYAVADGITENGDQGTAGFGRYVRIDTAEGWCIYVCHLSRYASDVGMRVKAGDIIGYSGNTGNSTGPHVHFEVRTSGDRLSAVDPEPYIVEEAEYMLTTAHIQRLAGWMIAAINALGSGWLKFVNPGRGSDPAPKCKKELRFWTDNIDAQYIAAGRAGGHAFVRKMYTEVWQYYTAWYGVYFALANEPACNDGISLANLREYTLGAIEEANALGIKLVILNLPEGSPHDDGLSKQGKTDAECRAVERWKWEQLAECVKAAVAGGHVVGLHAYWRPEVEGPEGRWHALGRRKWDIEQLIAMGVDGSKLQVIINETGIDGGIAGYPPKQGWKRLSNATAYRAEMVRAEQYARTVPQFKALMYFTFGYEEPWGEFDHDEAFMLPTVAALNALGPVLMPTPAPAPTPSPTPQPVTNHEDAVRGMAWNALGVPYNPTWAFVKYAKAQGLGRPLGPERGEGRYMVQPFERGIVYAVDADWGNVKHYAW